MSNQTRDVMSYSLTLDSVDYPQLNRSQFNTAADNELKKFIASMTALQCDFGALQDLNPIVQTRFHLINGFHAVRQVTVYDAKRDSLLYRFDCNALLTPTEQVKPNGNLKADPLPVAVDIVPDSSIQEPAWEEAEFIDPEELEKNVH